MVTLLILIVMALVGLVVVAGIIVVLVRLVDSPKSQPDQWQSAAVPGWYPDHNDPKVLRYFDGRAWTANTRDNEPSPN
ncbi:hypothetical protein A5634_21350 [Mycobacterium asiaticum]|uniref:DUF2510 domain-containing protein n=1 Tax=Mycobacterium asiaticum TaxID=1790 RepID=A0A1A3P5P4_MYCAS|nr:DUF2510 domain-containing protein [Mycobacterium asiaticum]OBK27907.1 hypothetical protein A5634_21350 [Mycobacterium asiaticum]